MRHYSEDVIADVSLRMSPPHRQSMAQIPPELGEVGAFYSTAQAPEIVNSRREEQVSVSV